MKKTITMLIMVLMTLSCSNGVNDLIDNLGNSVPICVKSDATGTGDGRGWANAYKTIQEAVNAADAGAEIWVAGIFTIDTTTNIDKKVYLYGGFDSTESEMDERDLNNKTVIQGTGHIVLNADGIVMDGFKFTGSRSYEALGLAQNYSYILRNCEFDTNTNTSYGGGALNCYNIVKLEILNCVFKKNRVYAGGSGATGGGAIRSNLSHIIITDCVFNENYTYINSSIDGGGIYCVSSQIEITNTSFNKNYTEDSDGGALFCTTDSQVEIADTVFSGNKSKLNRKGGAIYSTGSTVKITDCIFKNNISGEGGFTGGGGGAIYSYSNNNLEITNSLFESNSSTIQNGGCIVSNESKLTVVNSIFNSNTSPAIAGAIYIQGKDDLNSPNVIVNSTFYNNTASTLTGAIYNLGETTLYLYNSIFWLNAGSYYVYGGTTTTAVLYNNAADDGEYTAGDPIDPQSLTSSPFVSTTLGSEDFRLVSGSSCIGAGRIPLSDEIPGFTMPTTDLAGNPRIAGGTIDIGAYERQ